MANIKTKIIFPILTILLAVCIMLAFSLTTPDLAKAGVSDIYIDIDLSLAGNGTSVYNGSGIAAQASVWQSTDNTNWTSSPFNAYEIKYYSGTTLLASAPAEVGTYSARAVSTYTGQGYLTTSGTAVTNGLVIKTYTYSIIYNHFAISYLTPASLVADGNDHIAEVGASIYCEGLTLVQDTDYEVEVLFEGVEAVEVVEVGLYTIKISMLDDIANSNIAENDIFTYEFYLVSSEVTASLLSNKLYYTGAENAPVLAGNINDLDFEDKFDIFFVEKILNSTNGYRLSSVPPINVGDYILRIVFNSDIPSYGLEENDHIDLSFQIVPKPYKVVYQGDGASFMANNAIVQQNPSMTITAAFTNLNDQPINITTSDYALTYWEYDEVEGDFLDLAAGQKPMGIGRYQVRLEFNKQIPQEGQNTFGSAHPNYKILSGEIIVYEFQIVNAVNYVVGNTFLYTGSPVVINPALSYQSISIQNNPSTTIYEVKYIYGGVENSAAPTQVGSYIGIVRFLLDYNSGGKLIASAGDEYRFYFRINYSAPTIAVNYAAGNFSVTCQDKATFEEGVDYTLVSYISLNGIFYLTDDLTGVGTYRTIVTIIAEDKAKGLLVGDSYVKVLSVSGGNPSIIRMSVANFAYSGNIKPVTSTFGTGIERVQNIDYTIKYFAYKNGVIDAECGYPVLPGTYRAVMTFNKADNYFGVASGYEVVYDYTITPMNFVVAFTPSAGDLVYDKAEKLFTASFKANNRPVTIDGEDYDINFRPQASTDYADFVPTGYINAGTYRVAVVFSEDSGYQKYGISIE
ncbi:MAG: hypothetical protein EOM87_03125, partial [Clostridia bacterium]|nr:hypothetical protein [Clostridia bacterium]